MMTKEINPLSTEAVDQPAGMKKTRGRFVKEVLSGDQMRVYKQKNKVLREFIRSVYPVFHHGFRSRERKLTDRQIINLAFKSNQNILGGASPRFRINYHNVLFSTGVLPKPTGARVYLKSESTVTFAWDKKITGRSKPDDQIFFIEFNATLGVTALSGVAKIRCKGEYDFVRYMETVNDELHYWMFFTSADGKRRSESVYLGQQDAMFDPEPVLYKPVKGTYI